jgi:hypothetical protein
MRTPQIATSSVRPILLCAYVQGSVTPLGLADSTLKFIGCVSSRSVSENRVGKGTVSHRIQLHA